MQKTLLLSLFAVAGYSAKACACTRGDASCFAKCYDLPNPTEEQAQKTNECVNDCIDNKGSDDCFQKCVNKIFKAHESERTTSKGPTATTVTKDPESTNTGDKHTSTKKATTAEKTSTESKPKPTTATKNSPANSPIATIGSAVVSNTFSVVLTAFAVAAYLAL